MAQELKTFTVEMKSLDQEIRSPVIAGAGDVNGHVLRVVFTQKAACQLPPGAKVYLNWAHQEERVKGYNVFTKVKDSPSIWEIHWPRAMLREGSVLCRIEIVDDISISPSNNFTVHVLQNPNDGSSFVTSDDYAVFEQAVIDMNSLADEVRDEFEFQRSQYDSMKEEIESANTNASNALDVANAAKDSIDAANNAASKAQETADSALDKANEAFDKITVLAAKENASGLYMNEI